MRVATGLLFVLMLFAVPGSPSAAPAAAGTSDERLEEFVPSEQVPAGSAISFPVDI